MTLEEFYNELQNHDWNYEDSNSHKVIVRGGVNEARLLNIAREKGEKYEELFEKYSEFVLEEGEEPSLYDVVND